MYNVLAHVFEYLHTFCAGRARCGIEILDARSLRKRKMCRVLSTFANKVCLYPLSLLLYAPVLFIQTRQRREPMGPKGSSSGSDGSSNKHDDCAS